jgi:hypothetical protein
MESLKGAKPGQVKKILKNNLYTAVYLLELYYRKNIPGDKDNFQKKMICIENYLKINGLEVIFANEEFKKTLGYVYYFTF